MHTYLFDITQAWNEDVNTTVATIGPPEPPCDHGTNYLVRRSRLQNAKYYIVAPSLKSAECNWNPHAKKGN